MGPPGGQALGLPGARALSLSCPQGSKPSRRSSQQGAQAGSLLPSFNLLGGGVGARLLGSGADARRSREEARPCETGAVARQAVPGAWRSAPHATRGALPGSRLRTQGCPSPPPLPVCLSSQGRTGGKMGSPGVGRRGLLWLWLASLCGQLAEGDVRSDIKALSEVTVSRVRQVRRLLPRLLPPAAGEARPCAAALRLCAQGAGAAGLGRIPPELRLWRAARRSAGFAHRPLAPLQRAAAPRPWHKKPAGPSPACCCCSDGWGGGSVRGAAAARPAPPPPV